VDFFLRFAYWYALLLCIPLCLLAAYIRYAFYRPVVYGYSLTSFIRSKGLETRHPFKIILYAIRFITLLFLAFLIGNPQIIHPRSKIQVDGIDIMLVLDVSGSMEAKDYGANKDSRVEVAKKEAVRFINKRNNDPIGLVIFAQNAVSRCPVTLDKRVLKDIVNQLHIGVINPDGTVLSTAIATAASRLKDSTSKSKVMIVLTDGTPSQHDISPEVAVEVAQKLGIKIYTIGIGSDENKMIHHPSYGTVIIPGINKKLLSGIAKPTGGRFFLARNQRDMRAVYNTIDSLEKTEHETNIYSKYYDFFMPFLWCILILVLFELLLSSTIWFSL
jgi:Ca-activated chloride channel family protein